MESYLQELIQRNLPLEVIQFFYIVIGILIVATVITWVMDRMRNGRLKEIKLKIVSWWMISVLIMAAIAIGKPGVLLLFTFISYLGLVEFFKLIQVTDLEKRTFLLVPLILIGQYYFIFVEWYKMFLIFIPVYVYLALPLPMILTGQPQGYLKSSARLYWGVMINVFCISHAAYLYQLPSIKNPGAYIPGALLYLIFMTESNDVAQFLWGKSIGRHKIVPQISPNKTWEGFVGGVLTTTIISYFLGPFLTVMNVQQSVISGFCISVLGFFGDISISAIKRDVGVKDAGQLIPGHGGILDRIDSLTYTALFLMHYMKYLFY